MHIDSLIAFLEDQRIPSRILGLCYSTMAAGDGSKTKVISLGTIKRWIAILVRRSLLLSLVKNSVQLHDIVRDYIMSNSDESDIQAHQKRFVSDFISSQESWETVNSEKIEKGKELDWYLSSSGMQWHMSQAWTKPLVEDKEALSWLCSTSKLIQISAAQAIDREDVIELAKSYATQKQYKQSSHLYFTVLDCCSMSKELNIRYGEQQIDVLLSIPVDQRDDDDHATLVRTCLTLYTSAPMGGPLFSKCINTLTGLHEAGVEIVSSRRYRMKPISLLNFSRNRTVCRWVLSSYSLLLLVWGLLL